MSRRGLLGFAAAACVACCAGPFLAAIGGIAAIGLVGSLTFGVASLATAGAIIVGVMAVRRRSRSSAAVDVPVELAPRRSD